MRRLLAIAVVLGFFCVPARAGKLYTGMKELLDAAEKSGRLALIVYMPPQKMPNSELRDYMLKSPASQQIIVNNFEVGEINYQTAGAKANEHMTKIVVGNTILLPAWVLCTPEGEYIDGGNAETIKKGKPAWRDRLLAAARKHPPINEQDRKKAEDMLAQAQKDLEAGQVKRAAAVLPKVAAVWYPKKFIEDRKKLATAIEHKSEDALEAAEAQEKPVDMAMAYERIKRAYPAELPAVAKAVKKQKEMLERNKELLAEVNKLKKHEDAADMLEEARRLGGETATVAKAKMLYRTILMTHADSPSAGPAKEELEKLGAASPTAAKTDGKGDKSDKSDKGDKGDSKKPIIPKPDDKGEAPIIILPEK